MVAPKPRPALAAMRFLLAVLALTLTLPTSAQAPRPSLSDVQSAYLYNFAKFVHWPAPSTHSNLNICITGDKAYTDTVTRLVAGEKIDSRPFAVRSIQSPDDVSSCDILFISDSGKAHLNALLDAAAGKPILTVSDIPGFLDQGGMIQFLLIDNRVRFSIDLHPVDRSTLSLSSELLKVAVTVKSSGGKP